MAGYIYLCRPGIDPGTPPPKNLFKIGRTGNMFARGKGYPAGTIIEFVFPVPDSVTAEKKIQQKFTELFIHKNGCGNEYFEGDRGKVLQEFLNVYTELKINYETLLRKSIYDGCTCEVMLEMLRRRKISHTGNESKAELCCLLDMADAQISEEKKNDPVINITKDTQVSQQINPGSLETLITNDRSFYSKLIKEKLKFCLKFLRVLYTSSAKVGDLRKRVIEEIMNTHEDVIKLTKEGKTVGYIISPELWLYLRGINAPENQTRYYNIHTKNFNLRSSVLKCENVNDTYRFAGDSIACEIFKHIVEKYRSLLTVSESAFMHHPWIGTDTSFYIRTDTEVYGDIRRPPSVEEKQWKVNMEVKTWETATFITDLQNIGHVYYVYAIDSFINGLPYRSISQKPAQYVSPEKFISFVDRDRVGYDLVSKLDRYLDEDVNPCRLYYCIERGKVVHPEDIKCNEKETFYVHVSNEGASIKYVVLKVYTNGKSLLCQNKEILNFYLRELTALEQAYKSLLPKEKVTYTAV